MYNVLVTGATGFIGKNLIEFLKSKNLNIIAYVIENDPANSWLEENSVHSFVYEKDLDKQNFIDIDTCIHLASYGVKYTDKNVDMIADVNIKLACKILQFCSHNGCKLFLSAGSCFEYGQQINEKISEEAMTHPEDLYAASKVAAEVMLKVIASQFNIKYLIGRPFSVYGKYEPSHRILPLIYEAAKTGKVLNLTGGIQKRDYLYVKDVVNAFYEIIINSDNFVNGEVINICSGIECSLKDFIKSIIKFNEFNEELFNFGKIDYRKNESMYFIGDNTKLLTKTNWKQEYSIDRALSDYNSWLKND